MLCKQSPNIKSAQILEHYRGTEEGKQLSKLMCWQHNVEPEAAEAVFEDSIEKLFSRFLELKTEELLQKARMGQISPQEKQELQILLNNP
jgi:DNA primase